MIGVFDSGIGGLSVLKHLLEYNSSELVYLADQAYMPYGTKSPDFIRHRVILISEFLIKLGCEVVVVGCNTATLNTPISLLRDQFPKIKFIGIEPPVKPLASMPAIQLLLVTPATANSTWLKTRLANQTTSIRVQACPGLAEAIESNNLESINKLLTSIHSQYDSSKIRSVGIGCTHYSLIIQNIQSIIPASIYDPSQAVARRVIELVNLKYSVNQSLKLTLLTTNPDSDLFAHQVSDLLAINTQVKSIKL